MRLIEQLEGLGAPSRDSLKRKHFEPCW